MKTNRYWILFVLVTLMLAVSSCTSAPEAPEEPTVWVEYDGERLDEYVTLDTYTGLTVSLGSAEETRGEAVWRTVVERAQVLSYPQEQLEYYVAQERARHRYFGEDVSEETILADAKQLVKEDLVYRYILRQTGMTLTETEKQTLFDRYVTKYVEDYGYGDAYVREHLKEQVYDSMLYDKTMEYLILNNTVLPHQG